LFYHLSHIILSLSLFLPLLALLRFPDATTTQQVDGGYLLNGSKTYITNGFMADVVRKKSPRITAPLFLCLFACILFFCSL
jgi:hypothetical protein